MRELIWIFPVLFMFHDMEEIIGLGMWLQKNKAFLDKKYPKISRTYEVYSTEGMAAAVMEELLLCLLICFAAAFAGAYGLWLGTFAAYTLHLLVHMGQSLILKQYIPAVITSVICFPCSAVLIWISIRALSYSISQLLIYGLLGIVIVAGNLKIAHAVMKAFTKRFMVNDTGNRTGNRNPAGS